MRCNNLRLVLGLGLVRVSSRVRVKVRVSVLVRVSIRTSWVVNFALFRCYRPVIYTRPVTCSYKKPPYFVNFGLSFRRDANPPPTVVQNDTSRSSIHRKLFTHEVEI